MYKPCPFWIRYTERHTGTHLLKKFSDFAEASVFLQIVRKIYPSAYIYYTNTSR